MAKKLNIAVWRGEGKPLLQYIEDNTDLKWSDGRNPTENSWIGDFPTLVLYKEDGRRFLRYSSRSHTGISSNRFIQYLKDGDETDLPFEVYF